LVGRIDDFGSFAQVEPWFFFALYASKIDEERTLLFRNLHTIWYYSNRNAEVTDMVDNNKQIRPEDEPGEALVPES
jgi:hypothetical protein